MRLLLRPDVVETLALCAVWFVAGLLVSWLFGGAARLGGHNDPRRRKGGWHV